MKRVLQPIIHRAWYTRQAEDQITSYFREAIYGPLLDMVAEAGFEPDAADQGPASRIRHAKPSTVAEALRSGRLWYRDGAFYSSRMTASLAKQLRDLGAVRDPNTGAFSLPLAKVPMELRIAIAESSQRATDLGRRVVDTLKTMETTVTSAPTGMKFDAVVDRIATDLEQQFGKTVDGLEGITVRPKMTPTMRAGIAKDFTESVDLSIKAFNAEQIRELRQIAEKNVLEGARADRLAALIEARFGIAKRKAVFLAGQETSLMISAYREHKYRDLGSTSYRWSTSHDERVRPAHRSLDKQVFRWDSPPQIQGTNRRCNPGEDFNCRCVALPIVEVGGVTVTP